MTLSRTTALILKMPKSCDRENQNHHTKLSYRDFKPLLILPRIWIVFIHNTYIVLNIIQPLWLCHQDCVVKCDLLWIIFFGWSWWAPSTFQPSGHTVWIGWKLQRFSLQNFQLIPLSPWVPTFHTQHGGGHVALYRGRYCPKESNPAITKKPAGCQHSDLSRALFGSWL